MDATHEAEAERLKRKDWIQTFTGRKFTPLDARPEDVCIEDIAHALSQKCRYTGHTKSLYSVAQHSVIVSSLLPPSLQLAGLLHDATEAYLPDVAAPIKRYVYVEVPWARFLKLFSEVESCLADVIFQGLGLSALCPLIESEEVKRADLVALATEVRDAMGPPPDSWGLTHEASPGRIWILEPRAAEALFLQRFKALTASAPRPCDCGDK